MLAITGATGQLGRLVVESLLKTTPAGQIVAAVRDPAKAADLASKGVVVRQADYGKLETLDGAFAGVDKLLLISSNELGQRTVQHQAVIDAAKRQGVKVIVYTSVLHAGRSTLGLAEEHRQTEAALAASGIPAVILRNGWYTENHLMGLPSALEHGAVLGSAGEGRFASAARLDYAEAAAAVLTREGHEAAVYELGGDAPYNLSEFSAELSRQAGKPVAYRDLPQAEYQAILEGFGMPKPVAELIADSDVGAAKGDLDGAGGDLARLIGRPTTPLTDSIAAALRG